MMKSSSIGNLLSNYGSKLWSLLSVFIFIPVYISYLGMESYAVIGFYALVLGIASFADAGMSSAVIREFSSEKKSILKYSFLILIERVYILICFLIAVLIVFFSNLIVSKWLNSDKIATNDLVLYIRLIGVGVPIQLLSSLYFGALFGLNNQIRANSIQIIWNIFKSGFVIVLFIIFIPSLELFFTWQIVCNIVYVIFLRFNTIRFLKKNGEQLFLCLKKIPEEALKYIGGMTVIAIISSINMQADKIITSSYFDLKIFAYYNIASTLAQFPVIMATPLVMSVFPLFSKFSISTKQTQLNFCFQKTSFLLHIIVFPLTSVIFLYTPEIIKLWTGSAIDKEWLSEIYLVIRLLVVGSAFLSFQLVPFYILLSKGKTKYTIYQGVFQICIGLPLLYLFINKYGLIGAGIPWIIINFGALLYLYIVVFKYLEGLDVVLFFRSYVFVPLFINVFLFFIFYLLYCQLSISFLYFLFLSILLSVLLNIFLFNLSVNKDGLFDIKNIFRFSNE